MKSTPETDPLPKFAIKLAELNLDINGILTKMVLLSAHPKAENHEK